MLFLACRIRPPEELGVDRILRLASEAGFQGIAVDTSASLALLPALAADSLRSGLRVGVSLCPLPEAALPRGRRLPYLSALEPDERVAAVKLAVRVIDAGASLGVPTFALHFGPVPLVTKESDLRLAFARREMGEGERGAEVLRKAREERRARAPSLLDACRAALEPLVTAAERGGAALALPVAATPWQIPSPREAQLLLDEFAGAPLGIALAPARWGVLEALQLRATDRWGELSSAARLVWANDQVGLETDLLLGLGELEPRPGDWPTDLCTVLSGGPDATFREVLRARRRAEELRTTELKP